MLENKQILAYDDTSKTFVGVCFILHGFDSVKEDKVRSKLLGGGGIDAVSYGLDCNHVIVDKLVYDDPICVAARRDGKTLVTGLWVDHSFDVGMPVDPSSVMYWPMRDLNGISGAESLVVCLTGYQRQDRDDIMTMVALMGASFSKPLVASKVTHLICYKFEGEKFELAQKIKKIKLLNHRWLEDCLKAWQLLPEADYSKSGYELEMDAEAKDSEEETEDIAPVDLRKKGVVSPQNTRVENMIFHQPPVQQEASRNSSYLTAFENFANVGDTSKIKPTPRKEVEHVIASASRSAKKSPDADLSMLCSKSKKLSLPLRSERAENYSVSPSAMNVTKPGISGGLDMPLERKDGNDSHGVKTPKRTSLHLDEVSSPSKRKATVSRGSSRSPILSHSPKKSLGSGLATKTREVPVSRSSVDGSSQLHGDASPTKGTSHLSEETNGGLHMPKERHLDGIDPDGVQASLAETFLHLDEGQTGNVSRKRRTPISRTSSRSATWSHDMKTSRGSELTTKKMELLISGSSTDGPCRLAGDISPTNVTYCLGEEASSAPKEALNISTTSEKRQERNDQALEHSREGLKNRTLSNLDVEKRSSGVEKTCDPADMNISKDERSGTQLRPQKKKMLSRKTLSSKPTICKGRITKQKGLIDNIQNALLQNECINNSNEAVEIEDMDNANISEKVAVISPTTIDNEPVDGETKASDGKGQNELDLGSDKEDSAKVEASHSGKRVTHNNKQAGSKTIKMKKGMKSVGVENSSEAKKSVSSSEAELPEFKSTGDAAEKEITKGKKHPLTKSKENKSKGSRVEVRNDQTKNKQDEDKTVAHNEGTVLMAGRTDKRPSKKLRRSADKEKENKPDTIRQESISNYTEAAKKVTSRILKKPLKYSSKDVKTNSEEYVVGNESAWFILSGHRLQRKEFQQVIKRLKGKVCRDSHKWSYQATHFIVPDPVRRTEKFFAAAASGCWILKTEYLTASSEAGRFLSEEPYEWHKKCLTEDGAINLEAPRKWRLVRQRTGHGAFYGMRIVIYGECIAPPLDTLKRVVKAGDGTILATSPPYTRFLKSGIDFAIVSPGMPRVDMWVQEFLRHEVPCILADYLVEYVCKPAYPLDRHVQYNTHVWAQKSLENLVNRIDEAVDDPTTPEDRTVDDVACTVCGSRDRGEEMLICGDESGSLGCGVGVHIDCLDPPLEDVPEEDWFCGECSRKTAMTKVRKSANKRTK